MIWQNFVIWEPTVLLGITNIDRVPSFYYWLKTFFSNTMQIWQLFTILKQPVHILVNSHLQSDRVRLKYHLWKILQVILLVTDTIKARTITNSIASFQSGSALF